MAEPTEPTPPNVLLSLVEEAERLCAAVPAGPWTWDQSYELDNRDPPHWALSDPASAADGKVTDWRMVSICTTPDNLKYNPAFNDEPVPKFIARSRTLLPELAKGSPHLPRREPETAGAIGSAGAVDRGVG